MLLIGNVCEKQNTKRGADEYLYAHAAGIAEGIECEMGAELLCIVLSY